MNRIAAMLTVIMLFASTAFAWEWDTNRKGNVQYGQDAYGNYTKRDNLYKDTDRDGVSNYYDRNDRNPNVGFGSTRSNSNSSYGTGYGSGNTYGYGSGNSGYGNYGYQPKKGY